MEEKKKFKDTQIGKFLKDKAPVLLDKVGDILPSKGAFGILKNIISKDVNLTPEDKESALKLIEFDLQEIQEITKRWEVDTNQDAWLPKNIRPLTLATLMLFMIFVVIADSQTTFNFDVKDGYIKLLESLLITVVVAYFGSRGVEKFQKIKKS